MKRKRVHWNKEKTPLENEVDWLAQVFMVLFKRVVGAKREQSIYSQKTLNCYAVGGNTWQNRAESLFFHLRLHEAFALLPSCLSGFIGNNTQQRWGIRKRSLVFLIGFQCLYKASLSIWAIHGKGSTFRYTPLATMYGQSGTLCHSENRFFSADPSQALQGFICHRRDWASKTKVSWQEAGAIQHAAMHGKSHFFLNCNPNCMPE